MPYYPFQLSATSRKIPQNCLNVKTLTFPMVLNENLSSGNKSRKKSFLQRLDLAARFGPVVLSVIVDSIVFTGFSRMVGIRICCHIFV